jgi:hypothetical protein
MEVSLVNPMKMRLLSIILITLTLSACGLLSGTPQEPGAPIDLPSEVETRVKEALSGRTGVAVEEIEVVEAEQREWPDACLGLAGEGEACAEVITPGWEITLRATGEEYVFRTDETADVIRLEE